MMADLSLERRDTCMVRLPDDRNEILMRALHESERGGNGHRDENEWRVRADAEIRRTRAWRIAWTVLGVLGAGAVWLAAANLAAAVRHVADVIALK